MIEIQYAFMFIGIIASIGVIGCMLTIFIESILSALHERKAKAPNAECCCKDCQWCKIPNLYNGDTNREVKCELWGGGIIVNDSSFCYRAWRKE